MFRVEIRYTTQTPRHLLGQLRGLATLTGHTQARSVQLDSVLVTEQVLGGGGHPVGETDGHLSWRSAGQAPRTQVFHTARL